jgi:predicted permease
MRIWTRLWRNLLRRQRTERDLDDEVRAALEILTDEKIAGGMDATAARRAAAMELGGVEPLKEQVRDVRAGARVETVLQDLGYAARLLRRNPLFTLTASLSLAIGIGATTAVFSVANGLLLRTATGIADPDRVVDIARVESGDPGIQPFSYPELLDVRARTTTLDHVYGYQLNVQPASLRVSEGAERVFAAAATTNFFQALGVPAIAGRIFGPGDSEQPGGSPIAVLSHAFWTERFAADPAIVGRPVYVNGYPLTVIGVAREGFRGLSILAPDLWVPTSMVAVLQPDAGTAPLTSRVDGWLMLGGRLKPGVSRSQASAEIAGIGSSIEREHPMANWLPPGVTLGPMVWSAEQASPIPAGMRLVAAGFATLLAAIVSLVLVIACANLAGVLLARATVRRREMALRLAIGAGRVRLIRQLLTETTLLFLVGGLAGLALARMLTSAATALLPALPVPVNLSIPLDGRVVMFSLGLAFVAAVLSGLAPALHGSKADVVTALKDETQGPSDRMRLRNAFVIAQVAFSLLLVITAALLTRSLDHLTATYHGFDPKGVETVSVNLSMAGYTPASGPAFARLLRDRLAGVPGVQSASIADRTPGPGTMSFGSVTVPGAVPDNGSSFTVNWNLVEPGYFETLRIPLQAGRDFSSSERDGSEPVAILGESAARRFWGDREAVGNFILVRNSAQQSPVRLRVVGVTGDVNLSSRGRAAPLNLYVPLQQRYSPAVTIFVRRSTEASLLALLRTEVTLANPNLPVLAAQSLESQITSPMQGQLRIAASIAGAVGVVGLWLAGMGIYGVTAFAVSRRTREIGVRISLGASGRDVIGLVLRQGMLLVGIGATAGLLLAAGAGRLLAARLFGVAPFDPVVFASATALFVVIGLVACITPAWRATKIQAIEALREG